MLWHASGKRDVIALDSMSVLRNKWVVMLLNQMSDCDSPFKMCYSQVLTEGLYPLVLLVYAVMMSCDGVASLSCVT